MPIQFGPRSRGNIDQLHPTLAHLLFRVADEFPAELDITVTDSFRGEAAQNKAFDEGKSKKRWPDSAHNKQPAKAFDFCCAGVPKGQEYLREPMLMRQGAIRLVAAKLGIKLKPLILWDIPHVEFEG